MPSFLAPLRRHAALILLLGPSLLAAPVQAQTGATNGRVFSSLFGGAVERPDDVQSLVLTSSIFGGYDDDIFARGSRPRSDAARLSGSFGAVQAGALYQRPFPRGVLRASAQTAFRYVTSSKDVVPTFHSGTVSYLTGLTTRTRLTLTQRAAYRPFFSVVPFATGFTGDASLGADDPDDLVVDAESPVDAGGDYTLASDRDAVIYAGAAGLSRDLSPRSTLRFGARYRVADFLQDDVRDFSNLRWGVNTRYTYRFTDYLGWRLGYGYRRFDATGGAPNTNHDIDAGLVYNQPFRFDNGRTQLAFSTGSTMLVRDRVDGQDGSGDRFVWRALGTALLTHTFAAPWRAQLSYVRSVGFLDGVTDPFIGDRVTAGLGGLVGRRTDVSLSAGYVTGSFGLRDRNFDTTFAGARIRTAITRHLALFAQYFYYQYDFAPSVADALFLPAGLERQGLRGGLTVWVPLLP